MDNTPAHVVIVGAGPRGVSVLQRLSVRLASVTEHRPVTVTLIDPFGPGGRIWRRDQPPELLMNTFAGDSGIYADPSHPGLEGHGPALYEWATTALEKGIPGLTEAELAVLRVLQPHDYAPRFLFGAYVHHTYEELLRASALKVEFRKGSVIGLTDRTDGRQEVRTADGPALVADAVVLATGHTDMKPSHREQRLIEHARATGAVYGPPALPTESPVGRVPAGADVVLRGTALNFFDLVAMFTQGRGGRFERDGENLRYLPSGREPVIHAGSRRGIPSYSRIDQPARAGDVSFLDRTVVQGLLEQAPDIDLRRDIWPAVVREATWIYCHRIGLATEELAEDIRRFVPETPEWDQMIAKIVPDRQAVDLNVIADPLKGLHFEHPEDLDAWMIAHLERDLAESASPEGPRAGIGAFLRVARGTVYPLLAAGGVSGSAYRRDAGWFHNLLRNIGNGPPRLRIEQLAALARAGVVRFLGGGLEIVPTHDGFAVSSSSLPGHSLQTRYVLDAFVSSPELGGAADPLWISLRDTGEVRAYERRDPAQPPVPTGAVHVDEPTSRVFGSQGLHPARFVLGAATEGLRWTTAMASRSGAGSRFVLEADAVAVCIAELLT